MHDWFKNHKNSLTHIQNSQISKTHHQDLFFLEGPGQEMDFEGLKLSVMGYPPTKFFHKRDGGLKEEIQPIRTRHRG